MHNQLCDCEIGFDLNLWKSELSIPYQGFANLYWYLIGMTMWSVRCDQWSIELKNEPIARHLEEWMFNWYLSFLSNRLVMVQIARSDKTCRLLTRDEWSFPCIHTFLPLPLLFRCCSHPRKPCFNCPNVPLFPSKANSIVPFPHTDTICLPINHPNLQAIFDLSLTTSSSLAPPNT